MIKKIDDNRFEVYDEVQMKTTDNKSVKVLQFKETVFAESLSNEVSKLESEINQLQLRLVERQSLLEEINNL